MQWKGSRLQIAKQVETLELAEDESRKKYIIDFVMLIWVRNYNV